MNESKEHIIIVASKLFLQKSYKEVTMRELVKETGLSKGAFYHYFESKEKLFMEVLDFFFTSVMTRYYNNYSRESFYAFYHDYAEETLKFSNEYLGKFKVGEDEINFNMNYFTLAFDAIKLLPEFRNKIAEDLEAELKIWTDVIKSSRKNGEIKSAMTDRQIAETFIYLSDGVAMHLIMRGVKFEEIVNQFLTLWENLYQQMKV